VFALPTSMAIKPNYNYIGTPRQHLDLARDNQEACSRRRTCWSYALRSPGCTTMSTTPPSCPYSRTAKAIISAISPMASLSGRRLSSCKFHPTA